MNQITRPHPLLYEINARVWLRELSEKYGSNLTLGTIPDSEWVYLRQLGFDYIWLMGVWKPSMQGTKISASRDDYREAYDNALPGWQPEDIIGSPYSITGYELNPKLGKHEELSQVRDRLNSFGMRLILDFVPNHVAMDHPWIWSHPDYFIKTTEEEVALRNPDLFFEVTNESQKYFIAHAKDTCFGPWPDTAQLNYFNPETRQEMIQILKQISDVCDGVRCDMTMLVLNENFKNIWQDYLGEWWHFEPNEEFWQVAISSARSQNPNCIFIAEDYWREESEIYEQQLGFDYTYDETLYKSLLNHPHYPDVKTYLYSDSNLTYRRNTFRYVENHDIERAVSAFGAEKSKAAAVICSTLMGAHLFHQGQLEGARIQVPVQLKRVRKEPCLENLAEFYKALLSSINDPCFHHGDWHWLEAGSTEENNPTNQYLLCWYWSYQRKIKLIVVNYAELCSQGRISIPNLDDFNETLIFRDRLNNQKYEISKAEFTSKGLYVYLEAFKFHLFDVSDKISFDFSV